MASRADRTIRTGRRAISLAAVHSSAAALSTRAAEPSLDEKPLPGPKWELDLEGLFRQYAIYVGTIAYRILGNRDELDDVVQDVFLRAHRSLRLLRSPEAVASWLATVTVRVSRQRLRRRRLLRWLRREGPPEAEPIDPAASPETRAAVSAIFRALEQVPVDARVAWSLRYLQGERLEQVAELCGCSLAAAKRRIAKARAALDQVVGDD